MPKSIQKKTPNTRRATRPNKAQVRAAQVRAQQMAAGVATTDEETYSEPVLGGTSESVPSPDQIFVEPATPAEVRTRSTVTPGPKRGTRTAVRDAKRPPAPRVQTLTREQEYGFIRADLRRLLLTAGSVLVVMIGLLFFIDG